MTDLTLHLNSSIFCKTERGQQEIQSRSLGLSLLVRRVLVLIDGQRSGKELEAFVPGHDIQPLISELLTHGCIDASARVESAAAPGAKARPKKEEDDGFASLPAPEMRSAKELDMARNFMTNAVNNTFGQHTRLSMIEAIFKCRSASELRVVYPAWVETMSGSAVGIKRLPEMRQKLFTVL